MGFNMFIKEFFMKVMINPTKPFYLDKNGQKIRCGNFPETGKVINYESEDFVSFFREMSELVEVHEMKQKAIDKYLMSAEDFDTLINYLLEEKFIITDTEFDKIYKSKLYNRQNAYFFMLSDKTCEINCYKNKKILILGLGGIGANVTEQLARAGFCNFILVDCDVVESSNLIRQNAYYSDDIGVNKVDALSNRLMLISNSIKIEKHNVTICSENDAIHYIQNSDFVICTLDKPFRKIRRIINNVCVKCNKPVIFSGFAEHVGMIGPFIIPHKTACLACIDKQMEEIPFQNVKTTPSFGPLCNIIASIVASEIINYFVDYKSNNLIGSTLMFNMVNYKTDMIKWDKNPVCKKCGDKNDSK